MDYYDFYRFLRDVAEAEMATVAFLTGDETTHRPELQREQATFEGMAKPIDDTVAFQSHQPVAQDVMSALLDVGSAGPPMSPRELLAVFNLQRTVAVMDSLIKEIGALNEVHACSHENIKAFLALLV